MGNGNEDAKANDLCQNYDTSMAVFRVKLDDILNFRA